MKTIRLHNSDKEAMVDDDWYDRLVGETWYFLTDRAGRCTFHHGVKKTILMHRVIMGEPEGLVVDHINGNPLDNRRENLRVCRQGQNAKNRRPSSLNTSGVSGVTYNAKKRKWIARIGVDWKRISLGDFDTKAEAMIARREAERQHYGAFGRLPGYLLAFDQYQEEAKKFDIGSATCDKMFVHAMGLSGECGEVVELIKKHVRDDTPLDLDDLRCELGDLFWYLTMLADDFGLKMSAVVDENLRKLADRRRRNVLAGRGDNR